MQILPSKFHLFPALLATSTSNAAVLKTLAISGPCFSKNCRSCLMMRNAADNGATMVSAFLECGGREQGP